MAVLSEATPLIRNVNRSNNAWDRYVRAVEDYALITKSITAVILFAVADLIAQAIEHATSTPSSTVDWIRTTRFAAFGLFGAPWSHVYFYYLDRFFPPTDAPWTKITLVKLLIDQFLQAPLMLAFMIAALSFMKGDGWVGACRDLQANFRDALIANCTYGYREMLRVCCMLDWTLNNTYRSHMDYREVMDPGVGYQFGVCPALLTGSLC